MHCPLHCAVDERGGGSACLAFTLLATSPLLLAPVKGHQMRHLWRHCAQPEHGLSTRSESFRGFGDVGRDLTPEFRDRWPTTGHYLGLANPAPSPRASARTPAIALELFRHQHTDWDTLSARGGGGGVASPVARGTCTALHRTALRTPLLRSLRPLWLGQGRGLRATHTTANTRVRRPHVLKLAIQDLWDASD